MEWDMKEIKAIIQPFKLTDIINALKAVSGLPGVTVSEVKGFGRTRGCDARDRVTTDFVEYARKMKLEIVVQDEMAAAVVDVIQRHAHTGNPGDGKIFVSTVDDVVRVSTNERGLSGI
jgi:nitrogen regulatory protein P-II 1